MVKKGDAVYSNFDGIKTIRRRCYDRLDIHSEFCCQLPNIKNTYGQIDPVIYIDGRSRLRIWASKSLYDDVFGRNGLLSCFYSKYSGGE